MPRTLSRVDFLVAGQGLAGSLLAWALLQRGRSVLVVDRLGARSSSRIAAGLINPLAGQRLAKMPNTETYLQAAELTYQGLAEKFRRDFLFRKPLLRLLRSERERQRWRERCADPGYRDYLGPPYAAQNGPAAVRTPYGAFLQRQAGYLDIPPLLDLLWDFLRHRGSWRDGWIDPADLHVQGETAVWRRLQARHVVFCDGFHATGNPWLAWLPFQTVQGEILTLRSPESGLPDWIINAGRWILPVGKGLYRFGATYRWGAVDGQLSASGRQELLRSLPGILHPLPKFHVVDQCAGVRPATLDKRPFIGCHPKQPRICICNGFGSKGAMLIPYYASRLADHLCSGRPLPLDADILRFAERAA